ncbi:MAG: hypothetical protein ACNA7O_17970 [Rhodobacterales bacterium]
MTKSIDCTAKRSVKWSRSTEADYCDGKSKPGYNVCEQTLDNSAAMRRFEMSKKRFKNERSDSEAINSSKDYAIYPHRDHVKADSFPFFLADYGDRGALSEAQNHAICDRHGLSLAQVLELSRLIGYSLDTDSEVSLVTITRAMAERRLNDRSLSKRMRDLQLNASEANALFDSFGLKAKVADDTASSGADSDYHQVPVILANEKATVSLDEARRILQPNDRSKERDHRRLLVVESCCYVALDAGWSLTYTTDGTATKNQRGGRLINLIKDVIAMVSANGRIASVHTLKSDIEMVRHRFQMRGDLTSDSGEK